MFRQKTPEESKENVDTINTGMPTPVFSDQELDTAKSTGVIYWEGAVRADGTVFGHPVKAKGYVEMTGYAAPFRKKL